MLLCPKPKKILCATPTLEIIKGPKQFSSSGNKGTAEVQELLSRSTASSFCSEHFAFWIHSWDMDRKMSASDSELFYQDSFCKEHS